MLDALGSLLRSVQSVVTFLGGAGNIIVAIAALLAAPYVDQLLIRRNRLTYRVLYNAKIGVVADDPKSGSPDPVRLEQLGEVGDLLERMSIVVIRIHNTGKSDITVPDFRVPLAFTFGRRIIWNVRIDDATNDDVRRNARESLEFYSPRNDKEGERGTLAELRSRTWAEDGGKHWQAVRFGHEFRLGPDEKFKLVVILVDPHGPSEDDDPVITDVVECPARLHDRGILRDAKRKRRVTLPRATGAVAVTLAVLLTASVWAPPKIIQDVDCVSGQLRVVGSTVFMPMLRELADQYQRGCRGAHISTVATGSVEGVREVLDLDPARSDELVAVTDGKQGTGPTTAHAQQLAIVLYHVVVNASAGVDGLTSEQLRGIYNGTYRDWNQLRGGASLPIRLIGRGAESGTRELFEQRVLNATEPGLSSNDCRTNDRDPRSPVIRCERNDNAEVVKLLGQIPGSLGYADAPGVAEARKSSSVKALTLDDKAFDTTTATTGYQYWTVEYLYSRRAPSKGSLQESFSRYVRERDSAVRRLTETGYVPCLRSSSATLGLCNLR